VSKAENEPKRPKSAGLSRRDTFLSAALAGVCCGAHAKGALAAGKLPVGAIPKIDIYSHALPRPYLDLMQRRFKDAGVIKRMSNLRMLWDIDARAEMLEQWPELQQVLTLAHPPPEAIGGPDVSPDAARIANDGLAEFVARHPSKFPAFVAAVPMNNVPAAILEMDRAIGKLGARGIEIKSNVAGRPLDDPEFLPIFAHAAQVHKVPIWLHPSRPASFSDYATETKSRYEIWQILGWPYETSVAMSRLVFSGVLDRYPDLEIITHHCGGMLPYFAGRAEAGWSQMGSRTSDEDLSNVTKLLKRPYMEQFKSFYGDTVLCGSAAALRCGLDFFGPEHVVFASDCPFDPEEGPGFIRDGMRSIEELDLDNETRRKIYYGNARRLLKADVRPLPTRAPRRA